MENLQCKHCGSTNLRHKGYEYSTNSTSIRKHCRDCNKGSYFKIGGAKDDDMDKKEQKFFLSDERVEELGKAHTYVITSAQNNTTLDHKFFGALQEYCRQKNASLIVIPTRYRNPSAWNKDDPISWDTKLIPFMVEENISRPEHKIQIMGACPIQATAVYPLTSIEGLCRGMTTVIGHPHLQMKTIPVNRHMDPIILTTTGAVTTNKQYSDSKAGFRARFNHSNSAVVVELDDEVEGFHLRHLNADRSGCFYDWDGYYTADGVRPLDRVSALVTGDEHVRFHSSEVRNATYDESDSIVNTLRPKVIVRHDVLDCYAVSHHHSKDFLTRYKKHHNRFGLIEEELELTLDFVEETTPDDCQSLIVSSNHNDHLRRWLNSADPKSDVANSKLYHMLMYKTIEHIEKRENVDPFYIYAKESGRDVEKQMRFLWNDEPFFIEGILVSMHGDIGPNGARGSRMNLSKIAEKSVIGHSHSPGILLGCYQCGTSSELDLEYNKGPSSWMHTHCLIYPNGKRQLINIVGGKWHR